MTVQRSFPYDVFNAFLHEQVARGRLTLIPYAPPLHDAFYSAKTRFPLEMAVFEFGKTKDGLHHYCRTLTPIFDQYTEAGIILPSGANPKIERTIALNGTEAPKKEMIKEIARHICDVLNS